jgi:hypothetical protein
MGGDGTAGGDNLEVEGKRFKDCEEVEEKDMTGLEKEGKEKKGKRGRGKGSKLSIQLARPVTTALRKSLLVLL